MSPNSARTEFQCCQLIDVISDEWHTHREILLFTAAAMLVLEAQGG